MVRDKRTCPFSLKITKGKGKGKGKGLGLSSLAMSRQAPLTAFAVRPAMVKGLAISQRACTRRRRRSL